MAQSKSQAEYNTFVGGLVTEANPLTFPENSSLDEANFVLNPDGSRQRRLGLDFTTDATTSDDLRDQGGELSGLNGLRKVTPLYTDGSLQQWGTLQVGEKIHFYKSDVNGNITYPHSRVITSRRPHVFSPVSLEDEYIFPVASGNLYELNKIDSVYGRILDNTGQGTTNGVLVRDFWGKKETTPFVSIDKTDVPGGANRAYNLSNMGWKDTWLTTYSATFYPSLNKNPNVGIKEDKTWDKEWVDGANFGLAVAPMGSQIISVSRSFRYTRAASAAMFAGRYWIGGFDHEGTFTSAEQDVLPAIKNMVLYSQIIQSLPVEGAKFYQKFDPTSDEMSDLLPDDGGVIVISDAIRICKLVPVGVGLLAFASNGVWFISGPNNYFAADNMSVTKATDIGTSYPNTVLVVEGNVVYMTDQGIFAMAVGAIESQQVAELSSKITSLIKNIPNKKDIKAFYDTVDKKIRYMYKEGSTYTELVYDVVLQAFYKHTYTIPEPWVVTDYIKTSPYDTPNGDKITYKILLTKLNSAGWLLESCVCAPIRTDFTDFGVPFKSHLITGVSLFGDSMRYKQLNYVVTHMDRSEKEWKTVGGVTVPDRESGCLMSVGWDFVNLTDTHSTSKKWSKPQQIYRFRRPVWIDGGSDFDYEYSVVTSKSRVRGSGRSLMMKFESEAGKECKILGWALDVEGGTSV